MIRDRNITAAEVLQLPSKVRTSVQLPKVPLKLSATIIFDISIQCYDRISQANLIM